METALKIKNREPGQNTVELKRLRENEVNSAIETLNRLKTTYKDFLTDVLGIRYEPSSESKKLPEVLDILIELRQEARAKKDFGISDYIREQLTALGIRIYDSEEKTTYDIIGT